MRRALVLGTASIGAVAFVYAGYAKGADLLRGRHASTSSCQSAAQENSDPREWDDDYEELGESKVLVVGDGNLSFSLALIKAFPRITLIATTFDSLDFILERYDAAPTIAALEEMGAEVKSGVDATRLDECLGSELQADRVIFNFPHVGGKSKIQKNRELITGFFRSAARHLSPSGEIWVSLVKGQGGTPVDKPRVWGDTWQVTACAATAGLVMRKIAAFTPPPGYRAGGYKSLNKGFYLEGSLRHIFVPDDRGAVALHQHPWVHDMSFWIPPGFDEDAFRAFVLRMPEVESVDRFDSVQREDVKEVPDLAPEYREGRSFRVTYRSTSQAIPQDMARELQLDLRQRLVQAMGLIMR